jgi:hypothetical protein
MRPAGAKTGLLLNFTVGAKVCMNNFSNYFYVTT